MKLKKVLSLILAVVMMASLFAGCGKKDEVSGIKVRVWSGEGATREFMEAKVDEFNNTIGKEKGIFIEYKVVTSLDEMTKNAFENGDGPEILGGSKAAFISYMNNGYVVPINKLPGGEEHLAKLDFEIPPSETYIDEEGNVYKYPIKIITGGLVYNKDLFKQAGLVDENGEAKPPQTWDEVVEYSAKIHEMDKTKYGFALPMKGGIAWSYGLGWAFSASTNMGHIVDFDKQEYKTELPENGLSMLEFILKLKETGSCFPGAESLDNDTLRLQFAKGNIGMFLAASWDVGVLTDQFPAECDWAVAEYPVSDINNKYKQQCQMSASLTIGNSALSSPEKAEAVMTVYDWMYSTEMLAEMYENGLLIPYSQSTIDAADESLLPEQMVQFAAMAEFSKFSLDAIPYKLEGEDSNVLYEKVWLGQITPDEAIAAIEANYTQALKKGLADGSIVREKYEDRYTNSTDNRR